MPEQNPSSAATEHSGLFLPHLRRRRTVADEEAEAQQENSAPALVEGADSRVADVALGIDLGTTAVKVGLFEAHCGRPVAVSSQEYTLSTPRPGWAELDPDTYWNSLVRGTRDVLAHLGDAQRVVAIGLSSQGQTFVMLDAQGRPLRPAIVWLDTRAGTELAELREALPPGEFYRRTGCALASVVDSAPKVLWVKRNEPDVFASARRVLVLPSYIAWRLTGNAVADPGDASSTGLWDRVARRWWPEALAAVGVDVGMLGEVLPSATVLGRLTSSASRELGLPAGVPVATGANDQTCGAVSMGNRKPGDLTGTVGTAMALLGTVAADADPLATGLPFTDHPLGAGLLLLAYTKTAAIVLTWYRDAFAPNESYETLIEEAATTPAGCEGLTCLPHLAGMATPSFDDSVRGGFLNVTLQHRRGHLMRAVLEAVCHGARDSIALMDSVGECWQSLTVSGGATRSAFWMQMLADSLGLPVRVPDCVEAACRGAALLALVAVGVTEAAGWPSGVSNEAAVYEPRAELRASYDESYRRYANTMNTLYPNARSARGG